MLVSRRGLLKTIGAGVILAAVPYPVRAALPVGEEISYYGNLIINHTQKTIGLKQARATSVLEMHRELSTAFDREDLLPSIPPHGGSPTT